MIFMFIRSLFRMIGGWATLKSLGCCVRYRVGKDWEAPSSSGEEPRNRMNTVFLSHCILRSYVVTCSVAQSVKARSR